MSQKIKLRIGAFWQALIVIALIYGFFSLPMLMLPKTLLIQYMVISVIGVLLYFSFDEARWTEFKAPLLAVFRKRSLWPMRWALLLAIPALVAFTAYQSLKPSFEPPVELRQTHPAPPSKFKAYGKTYDLTTLTNPVRDQLLAQLDSDADVAMALYEEATAAGQQVYYENCFFCHGDGMAGDGHYAEAFSPRPINFQDVGTIAQLEESFLFWRIATGGPGLPKEGTPWNSAMPVWHEMIGEEEIWNVITYLYDYVGQVPRIWETDKSQKVTAIKDRLVEKRAAMRGMELYQYRCMVCHGEIGMGDGVAADYVYPRPRDFSLGLYKYKTSPGSLPPRNEDLLNTIRNGLHGTSMPGWSSLLSEEQIQSLVPIVKQFDITATWAPEDAPDEAFDEDYYYIGDSPVTISEVEPVKGQIAYTPESIEKGVAAFEKACAECHGDAGRGNIISGKRLEDDWAWRIWPRDLSSPWTWRTTNVAGEDDQARNQTIARVYQRLSIGITGTPMPAHRAVDEGNEDPVSLEDRWHIANYVYSLREKSAPPPSDTSILQVAQVEGSLPDTGADPAWDQAQPVTLRMAPNIIKEERLFTPLTEAVTARALYNANEIAFLLEWIDRTRSLPGEEVSVQIQDDQYELTSDAVALQFPKVGAYETQPVVVKPLYRHGDKAHPTTIWYWNAGSIEPAMEAMVKEFDASGPSQALSPRDSQQISARGEWADGRWQVVFKRQREGDEADIDFAEGQYIPVSFAGWDGSNGEVGSKHTLSSWLWLLLPPKTDLVRVYGIPLGLFFLVFIAGLILVRRSPRE